LAVEELLGLLDRAAQKGIARPRDEAPAVAPPGKKDDSSPVSSPASQGAAQGAPSNAGDRDGAGAPPEALPKPHAPPGLTAWSLPNGAARLNARLAVEKGEPIGLDLDVPFGGTPEELDDAVAFAVGLGKRLELTVFDPQLGVPVSADAVERVASKWRESRAWMMDVAGSYEDPRGFGEFPKVQPFLSPRMKRALFILGIIVAVFWLVDFVAHLGMETMDTIDHPLPQQSGNPFMKSAPTE
jgi:hypothetical protein